MNRDTPTRPAAPTEQAPVEVAYFRPAKVPSFPPVVDVKAPPLAPLRGHSEAWRAVARSVSRALRGQPSEHWLDRIAREQRAVQGDRGMALIQAAADSDPGEQGEAEGRS